MLSVTLHILAMIFVLGLLIFVHELGHFVTAKVRGVKVEEFAFGFPPRLLSFKWGETAYSLNLLPFGGYVKMLGEEDPSHPRSFAAKGIRTRLLILSAGSLMNALLPFVLFSISLMIPQKALVGDVLVTKVMPNSPAERAALEVGDRILEINGRQVRNTGDLTYNLQLNLGREVALLLEREGSTKTASVVPRWRPPAGEGAVGIGVSMEDAAIITQSYPPWEAVPRGARTTVETLVLIKNEVLGWFIRGTAPQVVGPVGIFQVTGEAARLGIATLLTFTAFLSINLAIINILPLPALDGGRIVFVLLEAARRGKRVSPRIEGLVHLIGFSLLIGLIIMISYQDVLRIIRGDSIIP